MIRSVEARLANAAAEVHLVRVRRAPGWDRREGYVVGIGSKWVVLSMIDDRARPDGFSAVRRRDITSVKRARGSEGFIRRTLELDEHWPPATVPGEVDLGRTRGVIEGLTAAFPLICLMIEREDSNVAFIGRPQTYSEKTLYMREVTPNAEWRGARRRDWSRWSFGELTRIDAGGGYEAALFRVAGEPPTD
jgi:hypothetical protein